VVPATCERCVHLVECGDKLRRLTALMGELRREGFRPVMVINNAGCYTPASRYRCLRTPCTQEEV